MDNIRYEYIHDKENFLTINAGDSTNCALHFHRSVEILYLMSGKMECTVGDKTFVAEPDDIEDPLPFDVNAPVIEIEDKDYAFFYRDLVEDVKSYDGKKVKFKGIVARDASLKNDTFVCGRHVMTCCEADIAFKGLVAVAEGPVDLKNRDWAVFTAEIKFTFHRLYGAKGPVLFISKIEKCSPPEEQVATFF